ncbi:aminotransferase class V-fold PLP-dependent enzyme, partial [archaeon]
SEVAYVEASKPEGRLDLGHLESILYKRKKGKVLLNLVHVSNLTGVINPVKEIRKIMEETVDDRGFIYLDMAQSAGHMPINLDELDVDYGGASGHKMYGPTGIGLMFVNKRSEKVLDNKVSGGSAIRIVTRHDDVACRAPARFEPGTQNLEGAIELGYALDYLKEIGMERIERHDKELGRYFAGEAGKIEGVKLYGPSDFKDRGAVVSLNIGSSIRNYDIVERELDKRGISVRGGCFCSHIYTSKLLGVPITDFEKKAADMRGVPDGLIKLPGAVRFSFAFYNSLEDAYQAVEAVKDIAGNQTSLGI